MFESDQHEFDEEYAEISHPAPPLAKSSAAVATIEAPPAVAPSVTAPVATKSVAAYKPIVEEPEATEEPEPESAEQEEFADYAEKPAQEPPPKKKPNFILIGGFAALIIFAIFVVMTVNKPKADAPQPGDMGPGIVAVAGLRGHLDTRWDGNAKSGRLVYQLRIEPMEDRWGAGFSRVTSTPPMPLSVNVRLMDSSGFALCGKEIDFPFNPQNAEVQVAPSAVGADGKKLSAAARAAAMQAARQSQITQMQAAEVIREHGKDLFQNQIATDGLVGAVNAQGTLPCSPDQYRRADYWDFNTNFPTLDEQAVLLDPKSALHADPSAHQARRTLSKLGDGFVIQGDNRVTGYDSARGLLMAEDKTFAIDKRYGQATASDWSNKYTLIHYKCDQHASCALTAAGQAAVLHARLN